MTPEAPGGESRPAVPRSAWAGLAVAFVALYLLPLGVRPLVIPDESRYAEVPREMIESGNWTSPRLVGVRYFEKPVLGYWLNAASFRVFGFHRWALRLPSALAAGLAAAAAGLLVWRFDRRRDRAWMTVAVVLTALEVYGVAVFAVLDSAFSAFITGSLVALFFAVHEPRSRRRLVFLAACGAFTGLAFLTKGFLAFVLPVLVAVPYLAWERRWRDLVRLPWIPALVALGVCLPWGVDVALREPDFWRYFFWVEHVQRFTQPGGAQHPEPFWYFVPIVLGGLFPWTVLVPAGVRGLAHESWRSPLLRYAACWLLAPFAFFSASEGKLGTYILPCFPAAGLLLAFGLAGDRERGGRRLFEVGAFLLAGILLLLAAGLVAVHAMPFGHGLRVYRNGEEAKWIAVATGLFFFAVAAGAAARALRPLARCALFAVAPLPFLFAAHFAVPLEFQEGKSPEPFLQKHAARVTPLTLLVSDDYTGPAVAWFFRRTDVRILGGGGELTYGFSHADAKDRLLDHEPLRRRILNPRRAHPIAIVVDADRYLNFRHLLPRPKFEDVSFGFAYAEH